MDMPNISLKICYDLLIVTSNNIILLSLNLKNKLKSYFKNKTMIFAYEENVRCSFILNYSVVILSDCE